MCVEHFPLISRGSNGAASKDLEDGSEVVHLPCLDVVLEWCPNGPRMNASTAEVAGFQPPKFSHAHACAFGISEQQNETFVNLYLQ